MSTWMITGSSSGLGRALAESVLEAGHNAVLTARNPDAARGPSHQRSCGSPDSGPIR